MTEARIFFMSLERKLGHREVPLSWVKGRTRDLETPSLAQRERAIEVAPGVRITLMGTGDLMTPEGDVMRGAQLAIWDDAFSQDMPPNSDQFPQPGDNMLPNSDQWLAKGEPDDSHLLARIRGRLMQCDYDLYRIRQLNAERVIEMIENDAKTCRDLIKHYQAGDS